MIKIPRFGWDDYFMLQAHVVATRSTCDRGPELLLSPGRHGVGAVIVKDHRVIASGYNGSPPGQPHCNDPEEFMECTICGGRKQKYENSNICDCGTGDTMVEKHGGHIIRDSHCIRTIHSEMNALIQCALDGTSPEGGTIYCTASPCYDCAKAIIRARIEKVHFGEYYNSRYGLSEDVKNLFNESAIYYSQMILPEIKEQQRGDQNNVSSSF